MSKAINPIELKVQIQSLMREFPEIAEDPDLRLDTLEGETELFEVLAVVLSDIRQAAAMVMATEMRISDLKARRDRYEAQERGWRKFAKELMDTANLRKVMLPEATLSIRNGQPSVRITDEKVLPENYWRIKAEPNISAIKEALKAGTEIPGAVLNNAPDTLAILTK